MQLNGFGNLAAATLRVARKTFGAALLVAACAGSAFAFAPLPGGAPEIDPGSMVSAMALLTGGVLMLTDRWRRK